LQGPNQSLHEYLRDWQSLVQVLEHYGAVIGADGPYRKLVRERVKASAPSGATDVELYKLELTAAKLQSIAIAFLKRADKKRYGGLWSDLENQFSRGLDHFPMDLTNAHNLLLNYKTLPQGTTAPRT
jgi:hypothetical protein